jgi:hypothetical protein
LVRLFLIGLVASFLLSIWLSLAAVVHHQILVAVVAQAVCVLAQSL